MLHNVIDRPLCGSLENQKNLRSVSQFCKTPPPPGALPRVFLFPVLCARTSARKYILATGPSTERKLASNTDFKRNVSLCRCSPSTSRARLKGPPMRYVSFLSSLGAPSHSCSPLAKVWREHSLRQFRRICTSVPFLLTKHVNLGRALVWFTLKLNHYHCLSYLQHRSLVI